MPDEYSRRAAETLEDVAHELHGVSDALIKVLSRLKIHRRWIALAVIGLIIDLGLSVLFAFLINLHADDTRRIEMQNRVLQVQAQKIHESQIEACSIGNNGRENTINRWHFLLDLGASARTPEQDAQVARFYAYLDRTLRPVDCNRLYP